MEEEEEEEEEIIDVEPEIEVFDYTEEEKEFINTNK